MRPLILFVCALIISCGRTDVGNELRESLKQLADSYSEEAFVKDSMLAKGSSVLLTVDETSNRDKFIIAGYYDYVLCCHYPFVTLSGTRVYIDTAKVNRMPGHISSQLPLYISCDCDVERLEKLPLPTYDPIIWYVSVENDSSGSGARFRRVDP